MCRPGGDVAQLGEHRPCKAGVGGSNPLISTRNVVLSCPPETAVRGPGTEPREEADSAVTCYFFLDTDLGQRYSVPDITIFDNCIGIDG